MRRLVNEAPTLYSPETSINHTILTNWGSLQISDNAHAAYGLQPLAPTQDGGIDVLNITGTQQDPKVHIALLGPDEPVGGLGLRIDSIPGSLLMTTTIPYTKAALEEQHRIRYAEKIRSETEADPSVSDAELLSHFTDKLGAPMEEGLGDHVSQDIAHSFAYAAGAMVTTSAIKKFELDQTRDFLKIMRNHGSFLVASTLAAIGITNVPGSENFGTAYRIITPGLILGPQVVGNYLGVKQHLMTSSARRMDNSMRARLLGDTVQQGISSIYSRERFDEQFRDVFREGHNE